MQLDLSDLRYLARARLAIYRAARGHLYDRNVNLIDFGFREKEGVLDEDKVAIRFFMHKKYEDRVELEAAQKAGFTKEIPPKIDGFKTDVQQATFTPQGWGWGWGWTTPTRTAPRRTSTRFDPLQGGISVSDEHHAHYGTLGGIVKDRTTGDPMLISNWHVIVSEWYALPGIRILQPGWGQGGTAADTVAVLTRHAMRAGYDAAVARLTNSGRAYANEQSGLWPLRGVTRPTLGMEVVKSGCGSKITRGKVVSMFGIHPMTYRGLTRQIHDVFQIKPRLEGEEVSRGGDSGAFWVEESTHLAAGLHFAGANRPEYALAMMLPPVLDALDVTLLL